MRVEYADPPRLDAADAPRLHAEQEDVAGHALDREIFVDGADGSVVGIGDDRIRRRVGDRAAGRDRSDSRTATTAHAPVDPIAVEQRARSAARGRDAVGEHDDDVVELSARQRLVGCGRAYELEKRILIPLLGGALGDELLREDVARVADRLKFVHRARTDRFDDRRAFHKLVAGRREKYALRPRADPMPRASDTLERDGDRSRRPDLDDEVDRADVDA
ncbi:MAG TPA: hypothetical protein VFF43_01355, partial [Caldimonas sp.]|nr:hypothetical protein [Caldimonas sp.]